jgi:hypothetical protein
MKLNHPGLLGGADPLSLLSDPQAVQRIRVLTTVIHGKAGKLAAAQQRLNTGAEAPCWAFAMSYASLLLISHGNGVLQDADWFSRVENLMGSMGKVSKRWIIAGELLPPRPGGALTGPWMVADILGLFREIL